MDLSKPLQPFPKGAWANYPAGVIAGFLARGINPRRLRRFHPFDRARSAAACPAAPRWKWPPRPCIEAITGKTLDPVEKALLCQKPSIEYAGVPCGIMDQFISVMGRKDHLLLLDCRSRQTELVPMSDPPSPCSSPTPTSNTNWAAANTPNAAPNAKPPPRSWASPRLRDATAAMLQSATGKMEDVVFRRARHVIGEIERTVAGRRRPCAPPMADGRAS